MKRYILLLTTLVFLSPLTLAAQKPKQFLKVGKDFYSNGMFDDAIKQFTKAIEIEPDFEDAYVERAKVYKRIRNYEAALADYNKLCIFNDKEEEYFYNSAQMSYNLGDYSTSIVTINKALKVNRSYSAALSLKFNALYALEYYPDALEVSKEALRYKENDVNFYNYARVNEMSGMWDVAVDAYNKAIRKNGDFLEAYVSLGDLLRRKGNLPKALETVNNAISRNKSFVPAYRARSAIYADQLNYSKAIDDVSTILLIEPENVDMYFLRGKYYQGYECNKRF